MKIEHAVQLLNSNHPLRFEIISILNFAIIRLHDRNAGLSVLMTYALNGIRITTAKNLIPIIFFDRKINHFFSVAKVLVKTYGNISGSPCVAFHGLSLTLWFLQGILKKIR